jgi:hypothetical protein
MWVFDGREKKIDDEREDNLEEVELEAEVTDRVLEQTPGRVLTFILGTRRYKHIFQALAARGYSNAVARTAWSYLDSLGGFDTRDAQVEIADAALSVDEKEVAKTFSLLDAWDEPNFRLARATLRREFPNQYAFLFAGDLQASKGPASVLGIRTFVTRWKELDGGETRTATRKEDKAALARLAERGLDNAERAKVEAWLELVGKHKDPQIAVTESDESTERNRRNMLVRTREWFEEWSEVARISLVKKRDLMRLGLARQKTRSSAEPAPPASPSTE